MADLDGDEGWVGGHEVHMPEGRLTSVLGVDGHPLRYLRRYRAGFDLSSRTRCEADTPKEPK